MIAMLPLGRLLRLPPAPPLTPRAPSTDSRSPHRGRDGGSLEPMALLRHLARLLLRPLAAAEIRVWRLQLRAEHPCSGLRVMNPWALWHRVPCLRPALLAGAGAWNARMDTVSSGLRRRPRRPR